MIAAVVVVALALGSTQLPSPPVQTCVPIVDPSCDQIPLPPPPPSTCLPYPLPPICLPPNPPPPGDDPPTPPTALVATKAAGWVTLRWHHATDDVGLAGYRLYRDSNYIGRRGPLSVRVRLKLPCGRHRFRVEAVDSVGQVASVSRRVIRACG